MRDRLEQLLDTIPGMFQNNRIPESAFGAAVKVGYFDLKVDCAKYEAEYFCYCW